MYLHKQKLLEGFTKKYNVTKLIYYEVYLKSLDAIKREKQLKGWSRKKKEVLITRTNPYWKELGV